jgi:hypothetical protein
MGVALSQACITPHLSRRTRVVSPADKPSPDASRCFPRIRLANLRHLLHISKASIPLCNLNIVWVTCSYLQGLGASDCKRELTRDRRKSETANRSTAIRGWALRPILELAVCGVYKVQSCNRMCQGPVDRGSVTLSMYLQASQFRLLSIHPCAFPWDPISIKPPCHSA